MGLLDILLGRSKAVPPNLDQLFSLPSAAITLETAAGYRPTGSGSVCFKAAEGGGFSTLREEVDKLLALDNGKFTSTTDSYGFTWLVRETSPDNLEGLVTDLHAVNTSLVDAGFGSALLCTLVAFTNHPVHGGARRGRRVVDRGRSNRPPVARIHESATHRPIRVALVEVRHTDRGRVRSREHVALGYGSHC